MGCGGGIRNNNPINQVGEGQSLGCRDKWTHDCGVKMERWIGLFVKSA